MLLPQTSSNMLKRLLRRTNRLRTANGVLLHSRSKSQRHSCHLSTRKKGMNADVDWGTEGGTLRSVLSEYTEGSHQCQQKFASVLIWWHSITQRPQQMGSIAPALDPDYLDPVKLPFQITSNNVENYTIHNITVSIYIYNIYIYTYSIIVYIHILSIYTQKFVTSWGSSKALTGLHSMEDCCRTVHGQQLPRRPKSKAVWKTSQTHQHYALQRARHRAITIEIIANKTGARKSRPHKCIRKWSVTKTSCDAAWATVVWQRPWQLNTDVTG